MDLKDKIRKEKIIVILRDVDKEKILKVAQSLYNGGIRLMEVPFSQDGKVSDEETVNIISMLINNMPKDLEIGAGTVLNESQVEMVSKIGGKFIVSPNTNEKVIQKTKELGMISIPGALTPTEIERAYLLGGDFIKVFPVNLFGPKYIKTLKIPLPAIELLAVCGIDYTNIEDYLNAKATGVCIGASIVDKQLIANNDYDGLTNLSKKYVVLVKNQNKKL